MIMEQLLVGLPFIPMLAGAGGWGEVLNYPCAYGTHRNLICGVMGVKVTED